MNDLLNEFVEEARSVSIEDAAALLGLDFTRHRHEHAQPCPVCGGTDTFAFNTAKNKWNCRTGGAGGGDAIGMAAHVLGHDLRRREGFLEACSALTGREIPEGGERESEHDRRERQAHLARIRQQNEAKRADRVAGQNAFRDRERGKARGIYDCAAPLWSAVAPFGRHYLERRGCGWTHDQWLRVAVDQPYWHGSDEGGRPSAVHSGPAMIAPFIDLSGEVIGCHITWIDLTCAPKFRPVLTDPSTGEVLPSKKMRGTKKGGVIPLAGDPASRRWLGAEGIENTLAMARYEGFRDDTFYFAAGDLGNMAGPADPASRFAHPELKKADRNGRQRPVMVPGPVPLVKPDDAEPAAMVVPEHVDALVLLGDGDSDPVSTASAMARARARHARPGRKIPVVWSKRGTDFAAMLAGVYE